MVFDDGRDLQWLRDVRPREAPSRLQRMLSFVWPMQSVELWDAWVRAERADAAVRHREISTLLDGIAAK